MQIRFNIAAIDYDNANCELSVNPWNDGKIGGEVNGITLTAITMFKSGQLKNYTQLSLAFNEAETLARKLLHACGYNVVESHGEIRIEK